jgi:hypothetical protein
LSDWFYQSEWVAADEVGVEGGVDGGVDVDDE